MTQDHAARPLLLVAHGDGGADPRDETVRLLAERLARRGDRAVAWGVLKRPESFDDARRALFGDAAPGPVDVYPLFMAEGRFVRTKLPAILAERGFGAHRRLPVFGLDPGLVDLIAQRLRTIASMQGGGEPADLPTLLVAHGSASGDAGSRLSSEAIAATLAERLAAPIRVAFIEEEPFFQDVIPTWRPRIVVGLFVSTGTHALDDVAALVERTPGILHHVAAIGRDAGVADLVERAIEAAGPVRL